MEYQAIEVEEAEPEYQEEQQPEFEISYQVADQDLEHDFTNSDTQQGKPRSIILTQCLTYILVLWNTLYNLCIRFIGFDLIPSCMR